LFNAKSTLADYVNIKKHEAKEAAVYYTKRERKGIYFPEQLKLEQK
jgi:hypothetical protein